jgi:hypothetical protein
MKRLVLVFIAVILLAGSQINFSSQASTMANPDEPTMANSDEPTMAGDMTNSYEPTMAADYWGALAFSERTHKYGWAINYNSKRSASERALSECTAGDCEVVLTFANSCGAYATSAGDAHWGWAIGYDRADAESKALAQCERRGGGCRIRVWGCSRGR